RHGSKDCSPECARTWRSHRRSEPAFIGVHPCHPWLKNRWELHSCSSTIPISHERKIDRLVVIFIRGFAGTAGAAIPLSGEKKLNNLVSELLTTAKLTVSDCQSEKEPGVRQATF